MSSPWGWWLYVLAGLGVGLAAVAYDSDGEKSTAFDVVSIVVTVAAIWPAVIAYNAARLLMAAPASVLREPEPLATPDEPPAGGFARQAPR